MALVIGQNKAKFGKAGDFIKGQEVGNKKPAGAGLFFRGIRKSM
jgi:hypothetical protein